MKRKDVLLKVVDKLQKKGMASRTAIVKTLFVLKKEYGLDELMKFYSFYPYKHGPFSQLAYMDLRILSQDDLINSEEKALTELGSDKLGEISTEADVRIDGVLDRFGNSTQLLRYVYANYPEFTVKSEMIGHGDEKVEPGFYTIGYEKEAIDEFLNELIINRIEMVVDVRYNPFSMKFSFIGSKLKDYLAKIDIGYVHVPELGIRGEDRKNLNTKKDYDKLFEKYTATLDEKTKELSKLIKLGQENRIALLCFEKDAAYCHRGQIADYIREQSYGVVDI